MTAPAVWEAAMVAFATSPEGQKVIGEVVARIVNVVLAGRGQDPAGSAEIEAASSAAFVEIAVRANASGDAFDAAVKGEDKT